MELEDTTIVVTGAAHGIGRAMTEGFVDAGARVAAIDVAAALETVVSGVDDPDRAVAITADVRSWGDVRTLVGRTRRAFGPIDVLVNNAGVKQLTLTGDERPTWAVPVATWDQIVDTNLRGPFLCVRAVVPAMLDRGTGRVIHVTSGHGTSARERRAPYVASKFGLEGFHRTLSRELVGTGVDSLLFAPPGGGIRTREAEFLEDPSTMAHEPAVVVEAAVQLASGIGENGGRYEGTADGDGVVLTHAELG